MAIKELRLFKIECRGKRWLKGGHNEPFKIDIPRIFDWILMILKAYIDLN